MGSHLQAVCDLIDELASCSGGRNNSIANSQMSQEVHSLLMLLSLALLQQTQQLRVLSDGVWCVEFRWSLLAIQPATDATPNKAHDVLRQSACMSSPAASRLLDALQTCFILTVHETIEHVDSMTGQGHRHRQTESQKQTETQHQPVHMQCNFRPWCHCAEQSLTCNHKADASAHVSTTSNLTHHRTG